MPFKTDMGSPSSIEEELNSLPDQVADAQEKWKTATLEKHREYSRLFLSFKAKRVGGEKPTVDELKAMVLNDGGYYKLCQEEIMAESAYTRVLERLMAAKKMANMRSAF